VSTSLFSAPAEIDQICVDVTFSAPTKIDQICIDVTEIKLLSESKYKNAPSTIKLLKVWTTG